jgi:hypothetical protein
VSSLVSALAEAGHSNNWKSKPGEVRRFTAAAAVRAALPAVDEGQALAEVCRSAAARWYRARMRAEVSVWLVAMVAAQRYTTPLPRPASHDAPRVLPAMRRATWYQLLRLVTVRAEAEFGPARPGPKPKTLADCKDAADAEASIAELAATAWRQAFTARPVQQIIGFLTGNAGADDAGQVPNIGRLIAAYAKCFRVDERTAYRHWQIVRHLGIVRQTQHSAQGRHARYRLCFPPARVPEHLPDDPGGYPGPSLAAKITMWADAADASLAAVDDLELYRYGSCRYRTPRTHTPTENQALTSENTRPTSLRAYYCQAWPLYAKARPPSPPPASTRRGDRSARARPGGITDEDRARAWAILDRCRPRWAAQQVAMPDREELGQLIGLVAVVLRYAAHVHPGDVVDLLSERVGSARDLVGLLRWRLQQTLRDLRRRLNLQVDEDGSLWQRRQDARAVDRRELHEATADRRAQVRALAEAARNRQAAAAADHQRRREQALRDMWPPVTRPGQGAQPPAGRHRGAEPEDVFAAEIAAQRGYLPSSAAPGPTAAELAARRRAKNQTPSR